MAISKRLALVISGAAFAGAAALTMGASPAEAATTSAPATGQHLTTNLVTWWGCGWDCCDCWDDWDWC